MSEKKELRDRLLADPKQRGKLWAAMWEDKDNWPSLTLQEAWHLGRNEGEKGIHDLHDRIESLQARIDLALRINRNPCIPGYIGDALRGRKLEKMPKSVQALVEEDDRIYAEEALNKELERGE